MRLKLLECGWKTFSEFLRVKLPLSTSREYNLFITSCPPSQAQCGRVSVQRTELHLRKEREKDQETWQRTVE